MSSRVLRKLHGRGDELKVLETLAAEKSSDEDDVQENSTQSKERNLFALLGHEDDDANEDEVDQSDEEVKKFENKTPTTSGARKKNKKKKKNNLKKSIENEQDIEEAVNEIAQMKEIDNSASERRVNGKKSKYVLGVEHRFLNPDNELRRIFGARTLMDDANYRHRNRVKTSRGTWLSAPTPSWPRMSKTGLSMSCIEKSQKYEYYSYEHNREYQKAQFQFLDAVESSDHNQVAEVLRTNPYHVDSLLTLSDVCRVNDDSQMARELVERALYALEVNFHSQFNITIGKCRLQYKRQENRCLFLALYRHLHFVIQKGCSRTALELCKVLLNLDPDEDPLCVLLFIDFFALQAGEYEFLLNLFTEWEVHKNLSQLPNFAYSLAMAHFELASASNNDFTAADKLIQDALIRFPTVLMLLLEKCSIQPDKKVSSHTFFTTEATQTSPEGLQLLCNLFVARNHLLWKSQEILPWLERNVNTVLERVDAKDPEITKWRQKRKKYQKPPRNIYRYALICELPGVINLLPPDIRLEQILGHDPLPPTDTIVSYQRPERTRRGRSGNPFGLFLHSLLPQFDPSQVPEEGDQQDNGSLHEQFRTLMAAMRDMLGTIQVHQNEEQAQEEEFNEDEWD